MNGVALKARIADVGQRCDLGGKVSDADGQQGGRGSQLGDDELVENANLVIGVVDHKAVDVVEDAKKRSKGHSEKHQVSHHDLHNAA